MNRDWRDIAQIGDNAPWRYGLGIGIITGLFYVISPHLMHALAYLWIGFYEGPSYAHSGRVYQLFYEDWYWFYPVMIIARYVITHTAFILVMIGIMGLVTLLHRRSFWSLLGADCRFRPRRFAQGFLVWGGIELCLLGLSFAFAPHDFIYTFRPRAWFSMALFVLPLTAIQISAEELLYRGYWLQGLGQVIRFKPVLALLSAIPFAVPHFNNPEMARGEFWVGAYYLSFGFFMAWLTLKDHRLELPLGIHLAGNLIGISVVNTPDSVVQSYAIWTAIPGAADIWLLIYFGLQATLFYGLIFWRSQKKLTLFQFNTGYKFNK